MTQADLDPSSQSTVDHEPGGGTGAAFRQRWLPPLLALFAIGVVTALIATQRIPARDFFRWDEATHALKAMVIAHDLRQGDWLSFAFNSYRQVLYPPLHSWLLAGAYLVFGPSLNTIAGLSLALFALAAGLLYLAGSQLAAQFPQRANWTGLLAALLWLTSPPLIDYATQGMLEIPGLFALCLAILVMLKLMGDEERTQTVQPREYMLLGVAIALTYFVRTPYGIILGIATGITLLWRAQWRPARLWRPEIGYLLLPLGVIFAVWFAYVPKFGATWQWLVNYPDGVDEPYGVAGWLFYPMALVRISGTPWLFAIFALGLLYALFRRQPKGLVFLAVLILTQVLIGEFHQNKQARYLFPVLPAFFLLGGHFLVTLLNWRPAGTRPSEESARSPGNLAAHQGVGVLLIALVLIQSGLLLGRSLSVQSSNRTDPITPFIIQTLEQTPEGASTLIIGSMDMSYPFPPLLDWQLGAADLLIMPQSGAAAQIDEGRKLAGYLPRLPLPGWLEARLARVFTGYDQPAAVRTLYVGLPSRAGYSQNRQAYSRFTRQLLDEQAITQVIVIYRANAERYPRQWLVAPLAEGPLQQASQERFAGPNMTVEVWR